MNFENIKEVWDYRLSTAVVMIDRSGGTWVVKIFSKNNPDYDPAKPKYTAAQPLEVFDTGIAWEENDEYDKDKLEVCFNWLLDVRDEYALSNIEELKPLVKMLDTANRNLAELEKNLTPAERNAWLTRARASEEMKEFFAELDAAKNALKEVI